MKLLHLRFFCFLRSVYIAIPDFFVFDIINFTIRYVKFWKEYLKLRKQCSAFKINLKYHWPCLTDKTHSNPVEPIYFFQDAWAASKIFQIKPAKLIDVGSSVKTMSIISQFVPVTFIDIRKLEIDLPGLTFQAGDITNLPFDSNSIDCISSLCVVEHVGLGRYGDSLDANGSEKAIKELIRVTIPKGNILFSVPVDVENRVYFNAHRAFTRGYIMELFDNCELLEEKYIYGMQMENAYKQEFGTGLFWFIKN